MSDDSTLIRSITLERTDMTDSPDDPTVIRKVVYSYYGESYYGYDELEEGEDANGNFGDLRTATLEDADGDPISTDYYRYYTGPTYSGDVQIGYTDGLKYVLSGPSFDRLKAAVGDPFTASDSTVATYADNYFEYDSNDRVTKEVAQGAGCSTCSGGQGTFLFTYGSTDTDGNSYSGHDFNIWKYKTTETLGDGTENIVYTNFIDQPIVSIQEDTDGNKWSTYYHYDSNDRLDLKAMPSAVDSSYINDTSGHVDPDEEDETYATDLVGYNSGTGDFAGLYDDTGLVYRYVYGGDTITATDSTAGDVTGYLKATYIQNGDGGPADSITGDHATDPVLQEQYDYISNSDSSATVYEINSDTVYRDENTVNQDDLADGPASPTGAETTSYSYSFYDGTAAVESMTVTHPVVSDDQNGSGSADSETTYYDENGNPTGQWMPTGTSTTRSTTRSQALYSSRLWT